MLHVIFLSVGTKTEGSSPTSNHNNSHDKKKKCFRHVNIYLDDGSRFHNKGGSIHGN